ncbi:MAG: alpha/beta fold hydrolase [Sandarakinorhabdus sp.]|nr:alpha/beta fold hydrolase [Sandarakinorhabdus sp.]
MKSVTHHLYLPGGARVAIDLHAPAATPRALLFCLAGGGANRRYFDLGDAGDKDFSFAARMTAQGFAVAAADVPGVGDSLLPETPGFFPPRDAAAALHDALVHLRTAQPALADLPVIGVGHSMGGMLIVLQQGRFTDFAAVALLGSNAGGLDWALTDAERAYAGDEAAIERDLAALTTARFGDPFAAMRITTAGAGSIFAGESPAATARLRTARDRLFNAGGMMSMIPGSFRSEAEAVRVPLFLAFGENDIGIPPHLVSRDFPSAPDVTLLILPGTGHNHFGFSTMARLCASLGHWAAAVSKDPP